MFSSCVFPQNENKRHPGRIPNYGPCPNENIGLPGNHTPRRAGPSSMTGNGPTIILVSPYMMTPLINDVSWPSSIDLEQTVLGFVHVISSYKGRIVFSSLKSDPFLTPRPKSRNSFLNSDFTHNSSQKNHQTLAQIIPHTSTVKPSSP